MLVHGWRSTLGSTGTAHHVAADIFDGDDSDDALLLDEEPQAHEIASDPALRCRYPSKRCERQRATKKAGTLHSMCAFHRAKANRNQRRLEKRKRFLKDEARLYCQQSLPPQLPLAHTHVYAVYAHALQQSYQQQQHSHQSMTAIAPLQPLTVMVPLLSANVFHTMAAVAHTTLTTQPHSPRDMDLQLLELEPFRSPVPLFKEDLEELSALVDLNITHVHVSYAPYHDDEGRIGIV